MRFCVSATARAALARTHGPSFDGRGRLSRLPRLGFHPQERARLEKAHPRRQAVVRDGPLCTMRARSVSQSNAEMNLPAPGDLPDEAGGIGVITAVLARVWAAGLVF